ncbi:MerR family transcriptional regulator [Solemya velesiana gill symbiont]|uniref:MerR family transcriptional regulator n=1 Tax=Solemya velesiana gill symbiont TaxID=1918948 RepID=A0A1T2KS66_9GAMM|nr:MerR family DNA-binding transcriptional regulator [Solemya velesiana gill symbiont]OOZ35708.1 MerR family transcriptional regulator [Solemya velesiana gill symbiont]
MKDTTYSISELSKEYDITPRTIRFYEDQELLAPQRKGRTRIYSERDRVRLKLILRGKRLGFSLSEIKELFELYDTDPGKKGQLHYLLEKIKEHRATLEQQLQDIKVVLDEMKGLEKEAKKSLEELEDQWLFPVA